MIAIVLLGLLGTVMGFALVLIWVQPNGFRYADLDSFLKLVFTPLVGLVGAATGFYYGTSGSRRE